MNEILTYLAFTINFLIMFEILVCILLLIAAIFKTKEYSVELVLLGMISFCVFMGFTEFIDLTAVSYELSDLEVPITTSIMGDMFSLMAGLLIFGVAITKNKLKDVKLGSRK